jgi:hypothetical protein
MKEEVMLKEDKEKLKELMMNHSAHDIMQAISEVAQEIADDLTDLHEGNPPPIVKDYVVLSSTMEDLRIGKPFLV